MYHQLTRSIVTQLRKTHSNLARLDHDYQGHRVRAMRAIGHAIRVLGNRSGRYFGSSQTLRTGMNRNLNLGGAGRGRRMSQAQSDARMRQSLRSLQSIHGQLMNSSGITRHARATSPVRQAIGELGTALNIR